MDVRYKLKTAPTVYPVTLTELKANLHISNNDQDTLLQDLIYAAVEDAQSIMGRQIMEAEYFAYLDGYPGDDNVEITRGPVSAITAITYLPDGTDVWSTVPKSYYQLDNSELTARIRFFNSFSPDPDKMNTVCIEFKTGSIAASGVPKPMKDAVILLASEKYLHPENQNLNYGMGLKMTAAERLLRYFKVKRY